jgi:hypothetical protein
MISRQDLSIYQGDDYQAMVNVVNADGTPADITGYSVAAQIRRKVADAASTVDAELVTEVESPTIKLFLGHEKTVQLSGVYAWDLQLTETATGFITTILTGKVTILQEVTREAVAASAAKPQRTVK